MLKQFYSNQNTTVVKAATFGWLCVETNGKTSNRFREIAATFGWLCVETIYSLIECLGLMAATFGWLCVETKHKF